MRDTPKMSNFKYVSCIKIGGQPILPPIITAEERLELLKDKEKAVIKEKEIAMRLSGSATSEDESDDSIQTERLMEFIRNALPQEKLKNIEEVKMLQDAILSELKKYSDVEDDTLHNVDDISPIDGRSLSDISPLKSPEYARLSVPDEYLNVKSTSESQTTPRIRRNSYTLESPSTSVLAYLKSLTESEKSEKKVVRNLNSYYDGKKTPSPSKNIIKSEQKMILENNNITYNMEIAAMKIQAGIRGYLTRRLMKTYKVMELKNTIKDSLITALQLHSEPAVNQAELDLHRRLALQVEKVCEEFHHIFFELSPKEKMKIIQIDRNRSLLAKKPKYQNKSRPKTKSESLMSRSTPAGFTIKRRSHKSVQTDLYS